MLAPISLASGYGNFATPAEVVARVGQALQEPLPASPTEGLLTLREALARPSSAFGASSIVVTPGTKAALFLLLSTVLRPQDEVLLLTPNWFGFAELIAQAGGTLRTLPLSPTDNYAIRPEAVRAALTPRTRVLLFSNPNNPTGRIYTQPELETLLAVTEDFPELFVLADEIYEGICFGPVPVPSLLALPDPYGRHLVVNGFSKSHGLIGWNIGYLAAPPEVAVRCRARQFAAGGAVAVLSQLAAETTVLHRSSASLCQQLQPNRRFLLDFLATRPGALPHLPLGTYYAFPDLRAYLNPKLPPAQASADLVARLRVAGVDVVDGTTCWAPGFVRISYAVPEANLHEAVRRMAQVLY